MRYRNFLIAVVLVVVFGIANTVPPAWAISGSENMTTVAGNGMGSYSGDGIQATSSGMALGNYSDVVVDSNGNLYISSYDHRILKVGTSGIITTVAGTGTAGYNGDSILATTAQLSSPIGLAIDGSGNLYFNDSTNYRVRKVDTLGIITTVAGNGTFGFSPDGTSALLASFIQLRGIAVDATGIVYFVDHQRVRKVDSLGMLITYAGTGTGGYNGDNIPATTADLNFPAGLSFDGAGNLYIAENGNDRIRKVDTLGIITTVAGDGTSGYNGDNIPATSASLDYPRDVASDSSGNLYISELFGDRIRKVDVLTGLISTVAGDGTQGFSGDGGPATSAILSAPGGVFLDADGNLFIVDENNNRVRKVAVVVASPLPSFSFKFGSSGSGDGQFAYPHGVVTDAAGNIYVADFNNNRIQKFTSSGVFQGCIGGGVLGFQNPCTIFTYGSTDSQFKNPNALVIDPAGNIYVAEQNNNRIQKFDSSGTFLLKWGKNGGDGSLGNGDGEFSNSQGLALDSSGNVYVADGSNNRIQKFTSSGTFISKFSTDVLPQAIAIDSNGDIYLVHVNNLNVSNLNAVKKYNNSGTFLFSWGSTGTASGQFNRPTGVKVDSSNNVYVSDGDNNRIQKFDTSANFLDKMGRNGGDGTSGFGDGEFNNPFDLFIDAAGLVYVTDRYNHRVQVFAPPVCGNGIIQSGEQCDDSNVVNGDGCSSICQTEAAGGGRRHIPEEPPPQTPPPQEPVVEPPHPAAGETPTPATPVLPVTPLGLIQALQLLFAWMNPLDYQLTNISEGEYRRFHFILRMKQTLKTLAVAAGYSDGYGFNKPDKEPMENIAELIKVIMISFSDCYTPSQLQRAISHDRADNPGYWWAGYRHFLDPLMQRFFGSTYVMWAPISQLKILDVLEVFLADFCGKATN